MKNTLLICAIFILGNTAHSQYEPLQGMFWNTYSYFNPALSGYKHKYQGFVNYRSQWSNATRNPKDFFANGSVFLDKSRVSLGAAFQRASAGYLEENKFLLNSSYRINLNNNRFISLGLGGGISSQVYNTDFLVWPDSAEVTGLVKESLFTGDIGISYEAPQFMIGLSVKNINNPKGDHPIIRLEENRNVFLFTEGIIDLSEHISLKPRASIRADLESASATELNLGLTYKKKYSIGAGYRRNGGTNELIGMINWDILGKIRVAYAIEIVNGQFQLFGPSHEAVVGIKLKERTGSSVKKQSRE